MTSIATPDFWRLHRSLPESVRKAARRAYRRFQNDPQHRSLHFKKLKTKSPVRSVRINDEYRAVGVFADETIVWFWIGNHSDYERLLKNL